MRRAVGLFILAVGLLAIPSALHAQTLGTIAGVVKDTSDAVLPGVTVEASSPVLIEKTRSAVTDGRGHNTFNSDAILSQQDNYGVAWQNATSVIQPRFVKFQVRWEF